MIMIIIINNNEFHRDTSLKQNFSQLQPYMPNTIHITYHINISHNSLNIHAGYYLSQFLQLRWQTDQQI